MIINKSTVLTLFLYISVIFSLGCNSQPVQPDRTQPVQPDRVLSETNLKEPDHWWTTLNSTYRRYYGIKHHHFQEIWEGVKILRVTLMEKGDNYIFEIQCAGNIERARKKYGNRMLFHIGGVPYYHIFTTGSMNEAVLVEYNAISGTFTVNQKDEMVSAKMNSPSKEVARLDVKIDGDKMRIYLPGKYLPEKRGWWLKDKPDSFHWDVKLRLAVGPGKPIPTNIKDVFYAPMVYFIHYPTGIRISIRADSWGIRHVRD